MIPPPTPSASPKAPPTARADESLARRLRRMGVSGRRLRRGWTRERLTEIGLTLVYVVPLTLLIWVWAQDQQIETATQQNVSVSIGHIDAQKVVTFVGTEGDEPLRKGGRAGEILVNLTLQGPRVGLNQVLRFLRDEAGRGGGDSPFKLDLQGPAVERTTVALRDRLAESQFLRDAGVGVLEVAPGDVIVRVEEKRRVEATVVAGGDLAADELAAPPLFDPPTVTIDGPASLVDRLVGPDGTARVIADLPQNAEAGEQTRTVAIHAAGALTKPEVDRLSLSRPDVQAKFSRKAKQQVELPLGPVVLLISKPTVMEKRVTAAAERDVLNGLVVQGPSDVINRLRADPSGVQATVTLQRDDEDADGEVIRRRVTVSLPAGVTLMGEPPEVSITVRRRDATP